MWRNFSLNKSIPAVERPGVGRKRIGVIVQKWKREQQGFSLIVKASKLEKVWIQIS